MYREQIDKFIDEKKEEMLEDLKSLVRIDSQKGAARPGKPFGEGPAAALAKGEELMSCELGPAPTHCHCSWGQLRRTSCRLMRLSTGGSRRANSLSDCPRIHQKFPKCTGQ